jgi:hypothetical protein
VGLRSSPDTPVGRKTTSLSSAISVDRSSASPRVSATMKSATPSSRRSFFRLLNARVSTSGSRLARMRSAPHSTQVN